MRSEIIHQISWTTYQNTVSIVLFKQTESSAFTKIKVIARVSNHVLMGHLVSSQIHNKGVISASCFQPPLPQNMGGENVVVLNAFLVDPYLISHRTKAIISPHRWRHC